MQCCVGSGRSSPGNRQRRLHWRVSLPIQIACIASAWLAANDTPVSHAYGASPKPWTPANFDTIEWLPDTSIDPVIAALLPSGSETVDAEGGGGSRKVVWQRRQVSSIPYHDRRSPRAWVMLARFRARADGQSLLGDLHRGTAWSHSSKRLVYRADSAATDAVQRRQRRALAFHEFRKRGLLLALWLFWAQCLGQNILFSGTAFGMGHAVRWLWF